MELLDKNLEQLLKKMLENNIDYVTKDTCNQSEIDALIKKGFFTKKDASTLSGWAYKVEPTQNAIYYFQNKDKFVKAQKSEKLKQSFRVWAPIVISLISLIITICK